MRGKRKVAGIIVIGKLSDAYLKRLKGYHMPLVLVDHISLEEPTDAIMTDNKEGSYQLTKYLIQEGFTKIGFWAVWNIHRVYGSVFGDI